MIKRGNDVLLAPLEFQAEISLALHQLAELATALCITIPPEYDDFKRLKRNEQVDLWIACGARASRIDAMWQIEAGYLITQALEIEAVAPDSSEPSV